MYHAGRDENHGRSGKLGDAVAWRRRRSRHNVMAFMRGSSFACVHQRLRENGLLAEVGESK